MRELQGMPFAFMGRYLELEGANASHMKTTLVQQAARSQYTLTEAALGAALSRHDLGIQQARSLIFVHSYLTLAPSKYPGDSSGQSS